MSGVGLLFVGVVLFVNGLNSIGVVPARSAAFLNIVVGAFQIVFPTLVLLQSPGDTAVLAATWPNYLFGVTYLWFGLGVYLNLEPQGFGWYSSFVAVIALYQAVLAAPVDPIFSVIWFTWAVMWTLFFLVLALGRSSLGTFAGWFLILLGLPTCSLVAILQFQGIWSTEIWTAALALLLLVVLAGVAFFAARVTDARAAARTTGARAADAATVRSHPSPEAQVSREALVAN
ncbi:AmiS/UreI family transporter [Glaciibacter superstes]|uniref:AmiS/UreI family transporter n=1 Tax=Glaciibacter superstes TaxID=501023 RepID=UPI0003B3B87E|nr:AmiS/UreI family transporter [Glaciibacter superstes]